MVDIADALAAGAKGAAAGAVGGPIGAAVGGLGGLVMDLAPQLGSWLFGSSGGKAAAAVASAVQSVTGTSDADAAMAAIEKDPKAAAALRIKLAQIAADAESERRKQDLASLQAQLADVAGARAQTEALAKDGSAIAWGAPVISVVVLATFGLVMWVALTRAMPAGSAPILNVLLGTLAAMATSVVSYWVGSSMGSSAKNRTIHLALSRGPQPGRTD
ncbi:MAG: hypothetical protein ACP5NP_09560 [Acetobacteraceae bacterium]